LRPTPNDRLATPPLHTAAPVLGLCGFVVFDEHWHLLFTGDRGGFGVDGMERTWLAELQGGHRFRFKRWDLGVVVGHRTVWLALKSGEKELGGDFIFHGPAWRLGADF